MPVSVIVGGQFGSEGKGKVALELARKFEGQPVTVVRVGGTNSGHTGYDRNRKKFALRQLPAGCIDRNVDVVFPAGSYIDFALLLKEIDELAYPRDRIYVSKYARIITDAHKRWERTAGLVSTIGSTGSGVGAAILAAAARGAENLRLTSPDAEHCEPLSEFVCDTTELLRSKLTRKHRVIIEGTQGFGLSLLDGGYWPKATSRSVTASAALAEAGISPLDVDDVTIVLRSFPIRVAGDSGPLLNEITWDDVATTTGKKLDLREYTTVTNKLRRVGKFDASLVRRALAANKPTRVVLNHLDYIGDPTDLGDATSNISIFVSKTEADIGQSIDWFGFSEFDVIEAKKAKNGDQREFAK